MLVFVSISVFAQKVEKVTATYTYYAPENVSLEVARETALERAKIQAIADEFGTIVSETTSSVIKNTDGKSSVDFLSLGSSEVKGEWIETIDEPEYSISYEQGMLAVQVSVKGRIREIVSAPIDFVAKVLCNGTEDKFERSDFRNGDDLYLSFLSPVDGYLAVYLLDDDKNAFCILPYQSQPTNIYHINAGKRYILFSQKHALLPSESSYIDEYVMTADKAVERNQIYVIFSTKSFTKAADYSSSGNLPRQLDYGHFQEWLAACQKSDYKMKVQKTLITIKK